MREMPNVHSKSCPGLYKRFFMLNKLLIAVAVLICLSVSGCTGGCSRRGADTSAKDMPDDIADVSSQTSQTGSVPGRDTGRTTTDDKAIDDDFGSEDIDSLDDLWGDI